MSKYIDPEAMSPEDVVYVRQRPSLLREFKLQGLGDPSQEGYEGHDFEWNTYFDEQGNLRPEPLEDGATESEEDRLRREEEEARQRAEEEQRKAEEARVAAEAEARRAAEEGDEELPAEKQWNPDMTKAELDAVITARNADYDDDEQITIAKDDKASRIAALEQDDKELAGEE